MVTMRSIFIAGLALLLAAGAGCDSTPRYGTENRPALPGPNRQVWAVAPALNLSGQRGVDPLLQADLLYQQMQEVQGLTVIPVNRVVEVYAGLRLEQVQSEEQASLVCEQLGCDGLVVPTVTLFDPYHPPKFGAALQLFVRKKATINTGGIDPRELARQAAPWPGEAMAARPGFTQVVGMYDGANGTVRDAITSYAAGRTDPKAPLGLKEYLVNMDRYCGFVYHELLVELLKSPAVGR